MGGRFSAVVISVVATLGWAHADPVGGVVTPPQWIVRPTGEMVEKFYPAAAVSQRVAGRVGLDCVVLVDGAARCSVAEESPLGWGFGAAAMSMSRTYRFTPATRGGAPVEARYSLNIPFSMEADTVEKVLQEAPGATPADALDLPSWIEAPNFEKVLASTPVALRNGGRGRGVLGCVINPDRTLNCELLRETPTGQGVGAAALELSELFRVARGETRFLAQYREKRFVLPINFGFPAPQEPVGVYAGLSPVIVPSPAPEFVDHYYPRAARRAGIVGEATVVCTLKTDGAFECLAENETPGGQGFGASAVQIFDEIPAEYWKYLQDDMELIEGDRVRTVVPFTLY